MKKRINLIEEEEDIPVFDYALELSDYIEELVKRRPSDKRTKEYKDFLELYTIKAKEFNLMVGNKIYKEKFIETTNM